MKGSKGRRVRKIRDTKVGGTEGWMEEEKNQKAVGFRTRESCEGEGRRNDGERKRRE
jgi:hypothetical protein